MMLHLIRILALMVIFPLAIAAAAPACQRSCGDLEVPYPFGLLQDEEGCYFNSSYAVACYSNDTHTVPYLRSNESNTKITNISLADHELRTLTYVSRDCYNASGDNTGNNKPWQNVSVFPISNTKNKFTAIGCDTLAIVGSLSGVDYAAACTSQCTNLRTVVNGSCSGIGCCQTNIPMNVYSFRIELSSVDNHSDVISFNNCSYAFVAAIDYFDFSTEYLSNFNNNTVPTVLDWSVGDETCEEAKMKPSYMCKGKSSCSDADNGTGYRCKCLDGYQGNPYHEDCQDIDECKTTSPCVQNATCSNTIGNFTCSCPKGYYGDGRRDGTGCQDIDECNLYNPCHERATCKNAEGNFKCSCPKGYGGDGMKNGTGCKPGNIKDIALGVSISISFLLLLCSWLYWGFRQRKMVMQREKFFQQNGGLMLQKILAEHKSSMETTTIFTNGELKKATNNFHESTTLGQGGHGTVYKGEVNNKTVAIKKSKFVDKAQVEEFINEVIVLTQINHKNVVKLVGCCLETEVPLLVYEFITNGTLFDHIHKVGHHAHMSWRSRLRIAAETSGALSYLHSDTTIQVIHRDIKTANILLDDNFTAKVSDFGASRLNPVDQTQVNTLVQGTLGYLDPEYLNEMELNDKSDVYSFGVVLAELLTGMEALSFTRPEKQRNLSMYFVSKYKEGNLLEIIDKRIFDVKYVDEIKEVAKLATQCLRMRGEERPSMKEISMELEGLIRATERHPWAGSNRDETEYLLLEEVTEYDETIASNSLPYDSIKNQAAFQIGSGR